MDYILVVFERDSRVLDLTYVHEIFKLNSEQWSKYQAIRTMVCSDKSIVKWLESEVGALDIRQSASIVIGEVMGVIVL